MKQILCIFLVFGMISCSYLGKQTPNKYIIVKEIHKEPNIYIINRDYYVEPADTSSISIGDTVYLKLEIHHK